MNPLTWAGIQARRALTRGDLRSYDRWAKAASRHARDLADSLVVVERCGVCGDPIAGTGRDRCVVCRALGRAA